MPASVKDLLSSAHDVVPKISPEEARRLIDEENALLVDVRDAPELEQSGHLADAVNVSRGMLEFRADETMPSHNREFSRDRPVILYCASGGRSALCGKVLREMGYQQVFNLGSFKDAVEAGFPAQKD